MDYSTLKNSDFFTFFHITEIDTIKEPLNLKKILKTGGFQESIDLEIDIDPDEQVNGASLRIDHEWIGNMAHINPFATDLAKSFIATFGKADEDYDMQQLSRYLADVHGAYDEVVYVKGNEPRITELPDELKGAIRVFLRGNDEWEYAFLDGKIQLKNITEKGKNRLLIHIESTGSL